MLFLSFFQIFCLPSFLAPFLRFSLAYLLPFWHSFWNFPDNFSFISPDFFLSDISFDIYSVTFFHILPDILSDITLTNSLILSGTLSKIPCDILLGVSFDGILSDTAFGILSGMSDIFSAIPFGIFLIYLLKFSLVFCLTFILIFCLTFFYALSLTFLWKVFKTYLLLTFLLTFFFWAFFLLFCLTRDIYFV